MCPFCPSASRRAGRSGSTPGPTPPRWAAGPAPPRSPPQPGNREREPTGAGSFLRGCSDTSLQLQPVAGRNVRPAGSLPSRGLESRAGDQTQQPWACVRPCAGLTLSSLKATPGQAAAPILSAQAGRHTDAVRQWVPRWCDACIVGHVASLIKTVLRQVLQVIQMAFHLNVVKCTNYLEGS